MKYKTFEIPNVSRFVEHVENEGDSLFYRGQAEDWPLIPSIARVGKGGFETLIDFEFQILSEFRRLSAPYFEKPPSSLSEWVLHAQHHALPTRLLDWSTNPLKALFFAVEDLSNKSDAIVWSWDAYNVEWSEELPKLNNDSIYFHRPTHLNKRIIAQESAFLVFPLVNGQTQINPLQSGSYVETSKGRIEKFIIPHCKKKNIKDSLNTFGINQLSMYPSIEAIVENIKDSFYMKNH